MLDAKVLIEFRAKRVCTQEDLDDNGWTLDEMVRFLIKEEGLFGIVQDDFEIKSVIDATAT